jgi:2-dehydro-3-deoxygluconokinase
MSIVCFGEIMLRLSPPNGDRLVQANSFDAEYGGSEANVAVSLSQLGLATSFVTRVPDHELGRAALGAVARYGVNTAHCAFGGERLGLYFLEIGAGRRGSKVLYDRQQSGMASLSSGMIDWRVTLEDASWIHWSGITPALSASAAAATLQALKVASDLNIRVSCDLNYRDKLWKYGSTPAQVMPDLINLTDVMLGDATAFELYFGITGADQDDLLKQVAARFPRLQHIAMTYREGHSASHNNYRGVLYDRRDVYQSNTYELPDMLDRIGGGDAFMAGLIYGLHKELSDPQEIVEFAAAAAALKHYVKGDFNLSTEQEVRALMSGNTGGRVSR